MTHRPHSDEAEISVLGAMMLEPEAADEGAELVKASDFYHERHRLIYQAILAVRASGATPDALTVREELRGRGEYEKVGADTYLARIVDIVPTSANIRYHAGTVADLGLKRRLALAGHAIVQHSMNGASGAEARAEAERLIFSVGDERERNRGARVGDLLEDAIDSLEREAENAIATPWRTVNRALSGGLKRQELVIVAARPSVGKSALLGQVALQAARGETAVLFLSLEMSERLMTRRFLTAATHLPLDRLRKNVSRTPDEEQALEAGKRLLQEAPIEIVTGVRDLGAIQGRIRRFATRNRGGLIVLDYLQLAEGAGETRAIAVGSMGRALKHAAMELDCPVLAAAQLNREVERRSGPPQLSDLKESGDLEQDADVVLMLERPEIGMTAGERTPEVRGLTHLHVRKNRNGPTREIDLQFHETIGTFTEREGFRR